MQYNVCDGIIIMSIMSHYFVYGQKEFELYSKGFSYNFVYYAPRQK